MSDKTIQLVVYDTLINCMAAYLECEISEVEKAEGFWEWADWDGEKHSMPMQEAITEIKENNTWGWLEDKHIMHVWIGREAEPKEIIELLAHELGHSHRPYHKDTFKEEQKAGKYAEVAGTAYEMMCEINN